MADFPLGNVLIYLAVVAAPTAGFWLALRATRLATSVRDRRRRPAPDGPPIELIAADLRRVHRTLATMAPEAPALRRRATGQAYDVLLAQACAAVQVPNRLDTVSDGLDREIERLRVEDALRSTGLRIP
ncbi:MAG: hypothetical protein ACRDSE_23265 [Pseudonocardiaceae bacterium]